MANRGAGHPRTEVVQIGHPIAIGIQRHSESMGDDDGRDEHSDAEGLTP
jgi:hypothetical protein